MYIYIFPFYERAFKPAGSFAIVSVSQVEDMEKKLDFLVDMHIQHSEHLQVDSAGSAHMTMEPCDPTGGRGGSEIQRLFFNYAESFPHMSYQVPQARLGPGGPGGSASGTSRPTTTTTTTTSTGTDPHRPPPPRPALAAVPTYAERPTVLPISSLQDASVGVARTAGGGRGGADSPLSMLSVNHEELERSPSGFSISGDRDGEGEELSAGARVAGGGGWTKPRASYLAEGETDTDTDPFTPSGGGPPLPLSSTGEGFGDGVWSSPP